MAELTDEPISSEAEETPSGKKGGLPIVPIAIAVVLIGVIGAVAWFVIMPMLSGGGEEAEMADAEGETAMVEMESDAVYDPEKQRGIIEFPDPFTVKLRRNEGVLETETYLLVSLSLEVESPEVQGEMTGDPAVMAIIEDVINTFFAGQYPQMLEPPQWPRLKEELKARINEKFSEDYRIQNVYFHDFLVQPGG